MGEKAYRRRFPDETGLMDHFELTSFRTADELASDVANRWLDEIEKANRIGKRHCVALSGGRITRNLFGSLVQQARTRAVRFNEVHFFWADERCVPPEDPESNFKLAHELLFVPLKIQDEQVHRIQAEDSPERSVKTAERELRRIASLNSAGQPSLDLVLLGMGEDGHVASLFPDAPAEIVNYPGSFLVVKNSPKPPPLRISISYAAIAAARQVWVLVSGAGKESAFGESLGSSGKTPLARVLQIRQKTSIFSQIGPVKRI